MMIHRVEVFMFVCIQCQYQMKLETHEGLDGVINMATKTPLNWSVRRAHPRQHREDSPRAYECLCKNCFQAGE